MTYERLVSGNEISGTGRGSRACRLSAAYRPAAGKIRPSSPCSIPVVISEIGEQLVGQYDAVAGPSDLRRERIDRAIALTEIHVWGGLHTQGRGEVIHRGVQVRDSCTTVPRIDARCTWRTAATTRIVVSRFGSPRLLILPPARGTPHPPVGDFWRTSSRSVTRPREGRVQLRPVGSG